MGALSFAADTLATLSSAFLSRNADDARATESRFTVQLDDNAQRIFNEFSTGMRMLYLHGSRNPCNITKITCQNLKLLHTNLKSNPSYRKIISEIRNHTVDTHHWAWLPLLSSNEITASILYLPAATSISPSLTNPKPFDQYRESKPFSDIRTDSESFRQLYLTLLGNAELDIHNRGNASKMTLKTGEAFANIYDQNPVKRISAIKANSLILNIEIPAT